MIKSGLKMGEVNKCVCVRYILYINPSYRHANVSDDVTNHVEQPFV